MFTEAVAGALFTLVLLFFFVKDGEPITRWILARLPNRHNELAQTLGRRAWDTLSGYMHGVIIVAVVDAVDRNRIAARRGATRPATGFLRVF
jgi:predicted PurR-regulated permease PerM